MVVCLVRDADLHMAQRVPLPLTVSCSSKIQIGFTFLVLAHPGSPGQRAVKRMCVCVQFTFKSKSNFNLNLLNHFYVWPFCVLYFVDLILPLVL